MKHSVDEAAARDAQRIVQEHRNGLLAPRSASLRVEQVVPRVDTRSGATGCCPMRLANIPDGPMIAGATIGAERAGAAGDQHGDVVADAADRRRVMVRIGSVDHYIIEGDSNGDGMAFREKRRCDPRLIARRRAAGGAAASGHARDGGDSQLAEAACAVKDPRDERKAGDRSHSRRKTLGARSCRSRHRRIGGAIKAAREYPCPERCGTRSFLARLRRGT